MVCPKIILHEYIYIFFDETLLDEKKKKKKKNYGGYGSLRRLEAQVVSEAWRGWSCVTTSHSTREGKGLVTSFTTVCSAALYSSGPITAQYSVT